MKNKTVKLALIGFVVGMVIGNMISYFASGGAGFVSPEFAEKVGSPQLAMLIQTILVGIDGAICFGTTVLYDIESWSLAKSTILHWFIMSVIYIPLAFGVCWVSRISELLLVEGFMLVGFLLIWVIMCAVYKAQVRELNELQQEYLIKHNLKEKTI